MLYVTVRSGDTDGLFVQVEKGCQRDFKLRSLRTRSSHTPFIAKVMSDDNKPSIVVVQEVVVQKLPNNFQQKTVKTPHPESANATTLPLSK